MKGGKQAPEFLRRSCRAPTTLWAVAEPGQHLAMPVEAIVAASGGVARQGGTVAQALRALPKDGPPARVLICGSLYLAGEVLKAERGNVPQRRRRAEARGGRDILDRRGIGFEQFARA